MVEIVTFSSLREQSWQARMGLSCPLAEVGGRHSTSLMWSEQR